MLRGDLCLPLRQPGPKGATRKAQPAGLGGGGGERPGGPTDRAEKAQERIAVEPWGGTDAPSKSPIGARDGQARP